jgi:hypothetical protein
VDAVFVEHLEQLMIVTIVHMDSDDHRSLRVKGLLHDRNDVVGLVVMRPVAPNASAYLM